MFLHEGGHDEGLGPCLEHLPEDQGLEGEPGTNVC
jgi:hypothetical protein